MKHEFCPKDSETVIITVEDDEPNSDEKQFGLNSLLGRTGGDCWGTWGTCLDTGSSFKYRISKKTWTDTDFQKKYMMLFLIF
jgi:hypothetical protein